MPRSRNRRRAHAPVQRTLSWTPLIAGLSLTVLCQLVAIAGTLSIFKTMSLAQAVAINIGFTVARLLFMSRPNVHVAMILIVMVTMYIYWLFALGYGFDYSLKAMGLPGAAILSWPAATALLFLPDFLVAHGLGYALPFNATTKDAQS